MTLPNHNTALEEIIEELTSGIIVSAIGIHSNSMTLTEGKAKAETAQTEAQAAINKLMYEETLELIKQSEVIDHCTPGQNVNIASRDGLRKELEKAAAERYGIEV